MKYLFLAAINLESMMVEQLNLLSIISVHGMALVMDFKGFCIKVMQFQPLMRTWKRYHCM